MTKRHPANERVKRRYLQFLKDAKGRDEASLDAAAKAISRFEEHSKCRDFSKFHIEQARAFKAHLIELSNVRTGKPLSASTIYSTLGALKSFFEWLAQQPGYRSRIKPADAAYFNPPDKLARVATAHRYKPCPTLEQIRMVLDAMPASTDIERRDRALIAFAIATGARDRAIISFKLKHIDLDNGRLDQDARQVGTKRAKTFSTWLFPVGEDIHKIVADWLTFLRTEWGLVPKTPSSRRRASKPASISNSTRLASTGPIAPMPTWCVRSSARPSIGSDCHIPIRIHSGTRWSSLPMISNLIRSGSAPGRRILGTKAA